MSLYYCPYIAFGGTTFWLPPGLELKVRRSQQVERISVPNTNTAVMATAFKNQGAEIDITIQDGASAQTQADVLLWLENIWSNLSGRFFTLGIWSDRAWTHCALKDMEETMSIEPMVRVQDLSLGIATSSSAPDTSVQKTFSNYAVDYPYASKVGRPAGSAVTPGGGITPVTEPSIQILPGLFPGANDAITVAGHEHRIIVGGTSGSGWHVKGIQIFGAEISGGSTSTVRVSTQPLDGVGGSSISATIASGALYGAEVTGNVAIAAGSTLYVFVSGAGGHQNLQYRIRLEAD